MSNCINTEKLRDKLLEYVGTAGQFGEVLAITLSNKTELMDIADRLGVNTDDCIEEDYK